MSKEVNKLDYNYGRLPLPVGCSLKISPSSFSRFIERHYDWYRTEILGETGFTYSTSSVLGTVIHYCAERVGKGEPASKEEINSYIRSFEDNEYYSSATVFDNYVAMAETLVNNYVMENKHNYLEVEPYKITPFKDTIYVGGSLDVIQGTKDDCMIVDYKSYHSKTKPKSFARAYKYQLLVYAYLLRELGYNPTRIRLVYISRNIDGGLSEKTGKPLKSYPPEVTVLTEEITEEDMDFIKNQLELCVDTINASIKHPELNHVIWHDQRLKMVLKMNENEVEKEIQDKGLTASRLTPNLIDETIKAEAYHVFDGSQLTVCCLTLNNGFTVTGESACASPENFNAELGQKIARENARNKIWVLEGYALKQKLHEAA